MALSDTPKMNWLQLLVRAVLTPLAMIALLFIAAGRLAYWQAWVYVAISIGLLVLMGMFLSKDKGLIEERLNPKEGKAWDKFYWLSRSWRENLNHDGQNGARRRKFQGFARFFLRARRVLGG